MVGIIIVILFILVYVFKYIDKSLYIQVFVLRRIDFRTFQENVCVYAGN